MQTLYRRANRYRGFTSTRAWAPSQSCLARARAARHDIAAANEALAAIKYLLGRLLRPRDDSSKLAG